MIKNMIDKEESEIMEMFNKLDDNGWQKMKCSACKSTVDTVQVVFGNKESR